MEDITVSINQWVNSLSKCDIHQLKEYFDGQKLVQIIQLFKDVEVSSSKGINFENIQNILDEQFGLSTNEFVDYEQFLSEPETYQVIMLIILVIGTAMYYKITPENLPMKDLKIIEIITKPIIDHLSNTKILTKKEFTEMLNRVIDNPEECSISIDASVTDIMQENKQDEIYETSIISSDASFKINTPRKKMLLYGRTPNKARHSTGVSAIVNNFRQKEKNYTEMINRHQDTIDSLQMELSQINQRVIMLNTSKTQLSRENKDLIDTLSSRDDRIENLTATSEKYRLENEMIKNRNHELKTTIKRLESDMSNLEKQNSQLEVKAFDGNKKLIAKEEEITDLKHKFHEARLLYEQAEVETEKYKMKNNDLEQQLRDLQSNRQPNIHDSFMTEPGIEDLTPNTYYIQEGPQINNNTNSVESKPIKPFTSTPTTNKYSNQQDQVLRNITNCYETTTSTTKTNQHLHSTPYYNAKQINHTNFDISIPTIDETDFSVLDYTTTNFDTNDHNVGGYINDSHLTPKNVELRNKTKTRTDYITNKANIENIPPYLTRKEYSRVESPLVKPSRLDIMRQRNELRPAHLKTSYPIETMVMNTSTGANWLCKRSNIPLSEDDTTSINHDSDNEQKYTFRKPGFPKTTHSMVPKDYRQNLYNENDNMVKFGLSDSDQMINQFIMANVPTKILRDDETQMFTSRSNYSKSSAKNQNFNQTSNVNGESFVIQFSPQKRVAPASKKKITEKH